MILTLASSVTKRISKAIAPKFLRWSLNLHEYNTKLSLLPLAQRLVSIEVQDDYVLMSSKLNGQITHNKSMVGQLSSAWEQFVDQTWTIFFESRHQKLKAVQEEQLLPEAQHQKQIQKQCNESELATQRVKLLEQYVRPALLPNNSEHDLTRNLFTAHEQNDYSQQSNYDYFVKWIRGEYLIAKYGLAVKQAVKEYPTLRDDVAGLNSVGGTQSIDGDEVEVPLELILPKLDTIRSAFSMEDWSRIKVPVSSWKDEDESNTKITSQYDSLSLKNIIHNKLQGQIIYSGPLNAYFEMRRREDSYELWNYDYIFALANYLLDRIKALDSVESAPVQTTILDVGAGDGRLVYFLRRAMHQIMVSKNTSAASSTNINLHRKGKKTKSKMKAKPQPTFEIPTLIATDDGSWKAPIYSNEHIQVEKLSVVEAVAKYAPPPPELSPEGESSRLIVLCSWMPPQVDWTSSFRTPSSSIYAPGESSGAGIVEEYILIGECDDGTCGHNFHTWGNPDAYEGQDVGDENVPVAPYIADGYQRVDLEDLSLLQVSRFDCKRSSESKTVSFRRGGNTL